MQTPHIANTLIEAKAVSFLFLVRQEITFMFEYIFLCKS